MRLAEGLRSETLTAALEEALRGKTERLYQQLGLASGLPGNRVNMTLAQGFATECSSHGKAADKLILAMATLSPDIAPGATDREFLPMCGVLALGVRASREPSLRKKAVGLLHDLADDPRFRVREVVPMALARIGEPLGDELVADVASWMDGFFQATAVLLALSDNAWLSATNDVDAITARLDEAYDLIRKAPRSASRWPGFKALVEALSTAPAAIASRHGVPIFDRLAAWTNTEMPELRTAIETNLKSGKIKGRYQAEIERVRHALEGSKAPPRDPTQIVQGMRSRGKKRSRR